ncbi:MAG: hypothetical protein EBR10_08700 [Planctomycetes bacterium]|nr:hypothetical protein [Planctomycetota bacterium]
MRLLGLFLLVAVSFTMASVVGLVTVIAIVSFPSELHDVPTRVAEVIFRRLPTDIESWWPIWISAAFIAITQGIFLLPTFSPIARSGRPRSLRWTVIAASAIAAVLSTAWVAAALSALWLVAPVNGLPGWVVVAVMTAQLGGSWLLWNRWISRRAMQHDVPEAWIIRRVLSGSALLIAGTLPLDVIVRRKTDCYCAEGSMWALSWGVGGAFWCLGPAVFLRQTRRMRRALRGAFCRSCGHARSPAGEPICPECGLAHRFPLDGAAKSG